jgi:hypothetical protein
MATRLHALGDDEIATGRLGGSTLIDRADLPRNESTSPMASPDKALIRMALEELDDPHPACRFGDDLDWR